jgi:hypothetical protein
MRYRVAFMALYKHNLELILHTHICACVCWKNLANKAMESSKSQDIAT